MHLLMYAHAYTYTECVQQSHKHKVRLGGGTPRKESVRNLLKHSPCDKDLDLSSVGT